MEGDWTNYTKDNKVTLLITQRTTPVLMLSLVKVAVLILAFAAGGSPVHFGFCAGHFSPRSSCDLSGPSVLRVARGDLSAVERVKQARMCWPTPNLSLNSVSFAAIWQCGVTSTKLTMPFLTKASMFEQYLPAYFPRALKSRKTIWSGVFIDLNTQDSDHGWIANSTEVGGR